MGESLQRGRRTDVPDDVRGRDEGGRGGGGRRDGVCVGGRLVTAERTVPEPCLLLGSFLAPHVTLQSGDYFDFLLI